MKESMWLGGWLSGLVAGWLSLVLLEYLNLKGLKADGSGS